MIAIEPGELLKVSAVAKLLDVSRTQCWRMVWSGVLPSIRISERVVRVRRSELEAWLQARAES